MKKLIILIPFLVFSSFTQKLDSFQLPKAWEKDFSIKLYNGGGMYYGSTTVVFNSSEVIYTKMDHGNEVVKTFKLSENEKNEILKQLKLLKVENIKTKTKNGITHDQATTSICFLKDVNNNYCISKGATTEIEEEYKSNFSETWDYLCGIVKSKAK
ncbi:MAG: hypothetical protein SFY56_08115 [Bacteroidota bacterium]|nr:hypothetical protein [Bacteroidota bacterium]